MQSIKHNKVVRYSIGTIFGLVVIAYLTITSQPFIKKYIIPRTSAAIQTTIHVDTIKFGIFSGLKMTGLIIGDRKNPLLRAEAVRVRFQFRPMLRGKYNINEISLAGLHLYVTRDKDGRLNIPSLNGSETTTGGPAATDNENKSKMPEINIEKINIVESSLILEQRSGKNDPEQILKISSINLNSSEIKRAMPFSVDLAAAIHYSDQDDNDLTVKQINYRIQGKLDEQYVPNTISISATKSGIAGNIGDLAINDYGVEIESELINDADQINVSKLLVTISQQGNKVGSVQLTGTVKPAPFSCNLDVDLSINGRGPLDLVGSKLGDFNFGNTKVGYKANVAVVGGNQIKLAGKMNIKNLSLLSNNSPSNKLKPLDAIFNHNLQLSLDSQELLVDRLNLKIFDDETDLLDIFLNKSAIISLGKKSTPETQEPAIIRIASYGMNLDIFGGLLPPGGFIDLAEGKLLTDLTLTVTELGKLIELTGFLEVDKVNLRMDEGDDYEEFRFRQDLSMQCADLTDLTFNSDSSITSARQGIALTAKSTGEIDIRQNRGLVTVKELKIYPAVDILFPRKFQESIKIQNINVTGNLNCKIDSRNNIAIGGDFESRNLIAVIAGVNKIPPLSQTIRFNAKYDGKNSINFSELLVNIQGTGKPLIDFIVSGPVDVSKFTTNLNIKATGYPLLQRLMPRKALEQVKLENINFSSDLALTIKSFDAINLTGSLTLTDLGVTVTDYAPLSPLTPAINFDIEYINNSIFRINKLSTELSSDSRKLVQVTVSGTIDSDLMGADLNVQVPYVTSTTWIVLKDFIGNYDFANTILSYDGNVAVNVTEERYQSNGTIALKNFTMTAADYNLRVTDEINIKMSYDGVFNNTRILDINNYHLSVIHDQDELLNFSAQGNIDTTFSGKKSVISVKSEMPIEVQRLMTLYEPIRNDHPTISPNEVKASAAGLAGNPNPANYWFEVKLNAAEIRYAEMVFEELQADVELKTDIAKISHCVFRLNGGMADFEGTASLDGFQVKTYESKASFSMIPISPVLNTLTPESADAISGTIKSFDLDLKGEGTEFEAMKKTLSGKVFLEFGSFKVNTFRDDLAMLMGYLGIAADDFSFDSGTFHTKIDNQVIYIPEFSFKNRRLKLDSRGSLEFGGQWKPDMDVTVGFAGDLLEKVEKKGAKLNNVGDRFKVTPIVRLEGWSMSYIVGTFVPDLLKKVGVISSKDKVIVDVLGTILGNSTGKNDASSEKSIKNLADGVLDAAVDYSKDSVSDLKSGDKEKIQFGISVLKSILGGMRQKAGNGD